MDSGADLLVVGTEQAYEQRLRAFTGERRSLHLRGDEPPYGESFGSLMRLFRRFQGELRRIHLLRLYEKSSNTGEPPRHEANHGSIYQRFAARTYITSRSLCSSACSGRSKRSSAPLPTYEVALGSLWAVCTSPNPAPRPLSPIPTPSAPLREQPCAH